MKINFQNYTCKAKSHCWIGIERWSVSIQVNVMASVISTNGRWRIWARSCECHCVIDTVCVGNSVHTWTPGHKLYIVKSDGTDVKIGLFKSVNTRGGVSVTIGVACVLDVCWVLVDHSSTSWCPRNVEWQLVFIIIVSHVAHLCQVVLTETIIQSLRDEEFSPLSHNDSYVHKILHCIEFLKIFYLNWNQCSLS